MGMVGIKRIQPTYEALMSTLVHAPKCPTPDREVGIVRIVIQIITRLLVLPICLWISSAHAWWWSSTGSYEECLLSEMKGQDASMRFVVEKVCARRHGKEVYVGRSEVDYTWSRRGPLAEIEIKDSKEYNITRLEVRFAPKPCKEAKKEDWGEPASVEIKQGKGTTFFGSTLKEDFESMLKEGGMFGCMQLIEAWGKYK
jgi:hypothetical protein